MRIGERPFQAPRNSRRACYENEGSGSGFEIVDGSRNTGSNVGPLRSAVPKCEFATLFALCLGPLGHAITALMSALCEKRTCKQKNAATA